MGSLVHLHFLVQGFYHVLVTESLFQLNGRFEVFAVMTI